MTELPLKTFIVSMDKGKNPKLDLRGESTQIYLTPEYLRGDGPPFYVHPQEGLVLAKDGDLLILWDGDAGEFFKAKAGAIASTMVRINVDEDKIKLGFLFHQLKRHERRLKSVGAGSVIRHVDGGFFKRLPIPLMDDVEQTKIAEILDWSDSAIVAARESVAKAERLHDGLMQQMLIGRLKSDGAKRHDGDFNTDERIGLFPKGWKVRKLRQIVRLRNGKANVTSNLRDKPDSVYCYPVFGGNGVTGWSDRYLLESPTIVLGRVGEYCGVVHRTPAKAWITDNALYASEFPEPIDLGFLFYVLTRLRLNSWKATTGQPKITQSEILNIRVAIPEDPDEQARIAAKFNSVRQFINAKQTKIVALHRLKKSLMQNLLTGRIRLPVEKTAKKGK